MANKLKRDDRIKLVDMGKFAFEGVNKDGDVVLDSNDNYFIYLTNVNFKNGNLIEGRYLGTLTDNSPILDEKCQDVTTDGNIYYCNGEQIRSAKMVAINNKTRVIKVIASR